MLFLRHSVLSVADHLATRGAVSRQDALSSERRRASPSRPQRGRLPLSGPSRHPGCVSASCLRRLVLMACAQQRGAAGERAHKRQKLCHICSDGLAWSMLPYLL
jgi:hypothetical protein